MEQVITVSELSLSFDAILISVYFLHNTTVQKFGFSYI